MLKKFLLAAALSVASIFAFAQPYYPLTGLGIAGSATVACSTANAVLYNAATPCSSKYLTSATAGAGLTIAAGTAADNTPRALTLSQGWTDGTSSNIGIVGNFDMGATGTATGKLLSLQAGAAGTTEVFSVAQDGSVTIAGDGQFSTTGAGPRMSTSGGTLAYTTVGAGSKHQFTINGTDVAKIDASGVYLGASGGKLAFSVTAPTLASGGCSGAAMVNNNGTARFEADVGTSCSGSQPLVFTLPATTTGWNCTAQNVSNPATSVAAQSSAVSTTSVTITNYSRTTGLAQAWTDGDNVVVSCLGG